MEKYIGEILTFIVFLVLMISLILGGEIFYRTSQYNNFRTQALEIASRTGGYNQQTADQINWIADQYYNGTDGKGSNAKKLVLYSKPYTSSDLSQNDNSGNPQAFAHNDYEHVSYNQPIKFIIHIKLPSAALLSPETQSDHLVETKSQVRQGSQDSISQY